jgi:hypothetical protein
MIEKIICIKNFRCNDALSEIYTLGILANIENKNSDFKMIDRVRRIAVNYPIIDAINLRFQKEEFSRKKKSEMVIDEEVNWIVLLGITAEQYMIEKLKASNDQTEYKQCRRILGKSYEDWFKHC